MNQYLSNGRGGYPEIFKERLDYKTGDLDIEVLKEYIEQKCPTESSRKGRINIVCGK